MRQFRSAGTSAALVLGPRIARVSLLKLALGVAILLLAFVPGSELQAQSCGEPTYTCSTGSPVCSNGSWSCPCGGTECTIPPSQYICNQGEYGTPECGADGWYCYQNDSPIIVDTNGKGFHLTSASEGVRFDIRGTGVPIQIAWTAAGSGNAFLALDRNGNGKIDNGKELFGNFTEQPKSDQPNGYLALAEFDKPANGGNGDGIIDKRDAVFPHLLLWIDENHDGISQRNELHTLPELGVYSIALSYRDDQHFFDRFGNWFHYQSALNPDPQDGTSRDGRITYDVFFATLDQRGHSVLPRVSRHNLLSDRSLDTELRPDPSPVRSGGYRHALIVENDGTRKVQVWNESDREITAFVIRESSASGTEERTYFDVYTTPGQSDLPIPPGTFISRRLSASAGTGEVWAEVPAVIFKDGSSAGDPALINTILARRLRLHDRLLSLHDLLGPLVGSWISPGTIVEKLRTSLTEAVKQLPDDDLRAVDTMAFFDATSAFDRARQDKTESSLKLYLGHLERGALALEYSRPDLETIRTLPLSILKRSSESKLPSRSLDAGLSSKAGASEMRGQ